MLSEAIIRVEGLGKRYALRRRASGGDGLRHALSEAIAAPWRWLRGRVTGVGGRGSAGWREDFWALADVGFEARPGEVLGIIGRNGAGKSTLLKILSRITAPTVGRVRLRGRVASLLEVGTGFHPELTGRENIFLNGAILGMKRGEIRRKFDEIVAFAEVERFLEMPVKRYSSGMYMRLAFAVAAQLASEILVVDEVLAVGDLAFQRKCLGKMREVAGQGERTVLFVSHNMAAVRKLCSRVIWLEGGRVALDAAPEEAIGRYIAGTENAAAAIVALPGGGGDVSWVRLAVSGEDGTPRTGFRLGEGWRACVEFELRAARPHVIAAVGLRTLEGVALVTYWSAPRDLEAGAYGVVFDCAVPFCAGEYNFAVGVSSDERPIYYQEGVGALSIAEVGEGAQPFRSGGAGLVTSFVRPEIVTRRAASVSGPDLGRCVNA